MLDYFSFSTWASISTFKYPEVLDLALYDSKFVVDPKYALIRLLEVGQEEGVQM